MSMDRSGEGTASGGSGTFVGARVRNSANIALTTNVVTDLTFDTEDFDTDTIHSLVSNTGRLTCVTAGKYLIHGLVWFAANATSYRFVNIKVNGATNIASIQVDPTSVASVETAVEVTTTYDLIATDYVTLQAYQNTGGSLNILALANRSPVFEMFRIG